MSGWISLYVAIVSKESQRFLTYRSNIISGLLTAVFTLAVRYALWSALFMTGNAQGSTLKETISYYIISDLLLMWLNSSYSNMIGADIRSGDIATRLIKPVPYHLHMIAVFHANALLKTVTRTIPAFVIACALIGLLPPISASAFACFIVTSLLSAVIYTLIDLIISYTAFWLTDYWYIEWLKYSLFALFGGIAIPLWFYPSWAGVICAYLPFRYTAYQPMAFYLGRESPGSIGFSIGIQLLWIAVLFALERFVWSRAQKKLTVQGG